MTSSFRVDPFLLTSNESIENRSSREASLSNITNYVPEVRDEDKRNKRKGSKIKTNIEAN